MNGENPELNLGILSLFLISMSGGVLSTVEQPKPIIKEEVKKMIEDAVKAQTER